MNKVAKIFLFLSYLFSSVVIGGGGKRDYANAFLDIPLGARAVGLGSAYGAVANDGTAFYWNPAGVALINRHLISLTYADQYEGFGQYNFIGYNHQLSSDYAFSVAWIRYSVGTISEFKALEDNAVDRGQPDYSFDKYYLGTFDYTDNAIFFSFAKLNHIRLNLGWLYNEFPLELPIGVNFKIITGGTNGISGQGNLANGEINKDVKKFGIGVDIGTMIMFGMNDLLEMPSLGDFAVGINLQDATGTSAQWNKISSTTTAARDVTPPNLKFAMSYIQPIASWESNILFSFERNNRYDASYRWGMEYEYKKTMSLRLGIDQNNVSYGVGVSFQRFQIDYALVNQSLGSVHRISAGYKF